MKTGFPRHLMMTCARMLAHPALPQRFGICCSSCISTYVLSLGDGVQVDLNLGHGQDIGGRGHVDEELCSASRLAPIP